MFQLTWRLGGVEVEQPADAARYAVGDRDLGGAQQGHVAPAEQARGPRGILGREIRGRREDRALYLLGLEAVRILERAQQLGGSVQDGLAGVGRGGGGAAQSTQGFAHGTRWSVALEGDHGRGRSQGARSGRGVPPRSEERRVGKEWRWRGWRCHRRKNKLGASGQQDVVVQQG